MDTSATDGKSDAPGVRFAEQHQEIAPAHRLSSPDTSKEEEMGNDGEAQRNLQQLRTTLQNNIQSARAQNHAYEPISLPGSQPVSRIGSGTSTPQRGFMQNISRVTSRDASPMPSPRSSVVHSPPLTPAASGSREGGKHLSDKTAPAVRPPDLVTPQRSPSPPRNESGAPVSSQPKQQPSFQIGPASDSQPPSRELSVAGTPASTAPATPRPYTPSSDPAAHHGKRSSQSLDPNDGRYRFGNRDPAAGYANSGLPTNPNPTLPTSAPKRHGGADSKRSSGIFGAVGKKFDGDHSSDERTVSKSNLKRFFKFGDHKHHGHKDKDRERHRDGRDQEKAKSIYAPSTESGKTTPTTTGGGAATPPSAPSLPFADDHGLQSKYGKFGKILGSGAGGSVRLMKRSGDGVIFAVKQFRDRHAYESEKEYNKKVTAEFCIGSTLHHGNVIETIDIVQEKGKWYEVMEYAPFDLFATVMTGKMSRDEVTCCTLQILSGVLYLHSMGLAHRDLKLDNVVISEHGIMKLIDFGSAVVFRYPFENDIVLATGVVGSDPYLAPEVYDQARYDPRAADIWSIAIIFCCMTLRRFPWKAPRTSDSSYRLFVATPDPDQDQILEAQRKSSTSRASAAAGSNGHGEHKHHQHAPADDKNGRSEPVSRPTTADAQPVIKGPIRLLRLLPRETRHIIGRMLELDPARRATMDEILADPWVQNSLVCRQEENGVVVKAPNHTHTLQPSNAAQN